MTARYLAIFVTAASVAVLALTLPQSDLGSGATSASTSPLADYEINVRIGITAANDAGKFVTKNVRMTSGWHGDTSGTYTAIDTEGKRGQKVYAAFDVVRTHAGISAVVSDVVSTGRGCRRVQIVIREVKLSPEGFPTSKVRDLGFLHYYHTLPKIADETEVLLTKVGDLTTSADPTLVGNIVAPFSARAEDRANGITNPPYEYDGKDCPNFGDHLHQSATVGSIGTGTNKKNADIWRNFHRPNRYDDDGLGFDPGNVGYGFPHRNFCSDTWVFKVFPDTPSFSTYDDWAPEATNISSCGAPEAPRNFTAKAGPLSITVTWTAPAHSGDIDHYEYRVRPTTPNATNRIPESVGTSRRTSHTDKNGDRVLAVVGQLHQQRRRWQWLNHLRKRGPREGRSRPLDLGHLRLDQDRQ